MQQEPKNFFVKNLLEFKSYLELSYIELKKVTWPTKKEIKKTTIVIFIFVMIMSIFLGLVDLGLSKTIAYILSA